MPLIKSPQVVCVGKICPPQSVLSVRMPEPEPVQLFVSVTVTLYVPAVEGLMVDVVSPELQA